MDKGPLEFSESQAPRRFVHSRARRRFGTKAHVLAHARGRALGIALTPGQAGEAPQRLDLLAFLPSIPDWVVAERCFPSHAMETAV